MVASPDLGICNLALAQVPSAPIASTTENSLAANNVLRAYPQCLGELLERYPWRWANRRVTLAVVTNDRPQEWAAAYAVPADSVKEISVTLDPNVSTGFCPPHGAKRYLVDNGVLYSTLPGVVLEYTTSAIQPGAFPALFRNALIMELAARVVMPITKSRERQGDLIKASMGAWTQAIAEDFNQSAPKGNLDFLSYEMRARYEHRGGLYDDSYSWRA